VKQATILFLLALGGLWLAHLHVTAQTYHPVVRMTSSDGLVYTALLDATAERRTCGEANRRFIQPVTAACKECQVVFARCERQLEGLELALSRRDPIPHYFVSSPGVRLAVIGPAPAARSTCDSIAGDILRRGVRRASCVHPSLASS
jgi:hypothetical protein